MLVINRTLNTAQISKGNQISAMEYSVIFQFSDSCMDFFQMKRIFKAITKTTTKSVSNFFFFLIRMSVLKLFSTSTSLMISFR